MTVIHTGVITASSGPRTNRVKLKAQEKISASAARGLASTAEVDERYAQKQFGLASTEITRKYQRRRDRFLVNLVMASGL